MAVELGGFSRDVSDKVCFHGKFPHLGFFPKALGRTGPCDKQSFVLSLPDPTFSSVKALSFRQSSSPAQRIELIFCLLGTIFAFCDLSHKTKGARSFSRWAVVRSHVLGRPPRSPTDLYGFVSQMS